MAELLIEIFSEEIPARMQVRAGGDLLRLLDKALSDEGLSPEDSQVFTGPRRLTYVTEVEARSPDVREERKGPRVGSPEQALAGFMKAAGLSDISEAEVREDKKGQHYVAIIERAGRDTGEIIAGVLPAVMGDFPWPKSMRSGVSDFRWVRPLRGLTVLLDGRSVDGITVGGISSDAQVHGHRQMGRNGPFTVANFKEYRATLEGDGHVVIDHAKRAEIIADQAREVCAKAGLDWVEDQGLLDEVAGLVEWPVVLLGDMDEGFLALPEDVIRLTLKSHQKTFTVRGKDGKLAPHFLIVANLDAPDGGATITQGNGKVISARLSDAAFFISEDAKKPLAVHASGLERVVFHDKLGSFADKVERVAALAREIAPAVGADPDVAEAAARLAKADLVTGTVIEMTSLQGQIGRMMAEREGIDLDIARAIEEHYKPQGPSDSVPTAPVSVAVALADKLDSLVSFWAIDEKPTGSKDPYALRRAALGVVRLILENSTSLDFDMILLKAWAFMEMENLADGESGRLSDGSISRDEQAVLANLLAFLHDRLRVYLRDQGHKHDVIDAVISQGGDDLLAIAQRVAALGGLLGMDDGENLVAGYKRAANILKAEGKKGALDLPAFADMSASDFTAPGAAALFKALTEVRPRMDSALEASDYEVALTALAGLRAPVDAFFDNVMVNSDEAQERLRRLALLQAVVETAHRVADFSKLEG